VYICFMVSWLMSCSLRWTSRAIFATWSSEPASFDVYLKNSLSWRKSATSGFTPSRIWDLLPRSLASCFHFSLSGLAPHGKACVWRVSMLLSPVIENPAACCLATLSTPRRYMSSWSSYLALPRRPRLGSHTHWVAMRSGFSVFSMCLVPPGWALRDTCGRPGCAPPRPRVVANFFD